jgi:hypothetical protein
MPPANSPGPFEVIRDIAKIAEGPAKALFIDPAVNCGTGIWHHHDVSVGLALNCAATVPFLKVAKVLDAVVDASRGAKVLSRISRAESEAHRIEETARAAARPGHAAETGSEDLAQVASRIKNAGDVHPAQLSQQVIAVGTDADGTLVAASNTSSSFTASQRALMDELGILRAPSRTVEGDALHAEENLLGAFPEPTSVGLSALEPCAGRCEPLLTRFGIPWSVAK